MGADDTSRLTTDTRSLDTPSPAAALTSHHSAKGTRPTTDAKALDLPSAAAALAPYHSNRPRTDVKKLDTPSSAAALIPYQSNRARTGPPSKLNTPAAAAALTPYHNPKSGAPLKDPANHPFDTSSTAAAAQAITPLKLGSKPPPPDTKQACGPPAAKRGDSLPSYNDAVKASHALNVVKSHNGPQRGAATGDAKTFDQAIGFLDRLRERSKEGVYTQFLGILSDYTQGRCRPQEVSRKVTLLFHEHQHPDLVEEMYKWTPWQHRFYLPFAGCTR